MRQIEDAVISELATISNVPESLLKTGGIKIYTTLDDYDIRSEFWAAGKVIALGEVPLDAILIDTDLFLYGNTPIISIL